MKQKDFLVILLALVPVLFLGCSSAQQIKSSAPVIQEVRVSPNPIAPGAYVLVTVEAVDTQGGYMSFKVGTAESRNYYGNNTFVYHVPSTTGSHEIDIRVSNGCVDSLAKLSLSVDDTLPPSTLRCGRAVLPLGSSYDFFSERVVDKYYGDVDYLSYSYYGSSLTFTGDRNGSSTSDFDGGLVNLTYYNSEISELDQVWVKYTGTYYQRGVPAAGQRYDQSTIKEGDVFCFVLSYSDKFFGKLKVVSLNDSEIAFDWVLQRVPNETKFYDYSSNATALNSPEAPQNLSASVVNTVVTLTWDFPTETDIIGYEIYRSLSSGTGFSKIRSVGLVNSNVDGGLQPNTTYYYKLKALDSSFSESEFSSEISIATDAAAPAPAVVLEDDAENGTGNWQLQGFALSSAKSYSSSYSFHSGTGDSLNNTMTLLSPVAITGDECLQFNIDYRTETSYDYLYVQVSEDNIHWSTLTSFSGNSNGWITTPQYSLSNYSGKNIYLRFKYYTDSYVSYSGVYIDDIVIR